MLPWAGQGGGSRVVGGCELMPATEVEEQRDGACSQGEQAEMGGKVCSQ